MRAIWAGLINLAIYTGNIVVKNRRKRGEKEHPVELPRDARFSWRDAGNSNPRRAFSDFLLIFRHFIFTPTKAEFAPLKPIKNIR